MTSSLWFSVQWFLLKDLFSIIAPPTSPPPWFLLIDFSSMILRIGLQRDSVWGLALGSFFELLRAWGTGAPVAMSLDFLNCLIYELLVFVELLRPWGTGAPVAMSLAFFNCWFFELLRPWGTGAPVAMSLEFLNCWIFEWLRPWGTGAAINLELQQSFKSLGIVSPFHSSLRGVGSAPSLKKAEVGFIIVS